MCGLVAGFVYWQKAITGTAGGDNPRSVVLEDATAISAYPEEGIVLIGCRICQDEAIAGLFEFSRRTQGWSGCSEGVNGPHFIIKTDVSHHECNSKLLEAGAKVYRQFPVVEAVQKMESGHTTHESYLDGTPVLVSLRWKQDGQVKEVPYERCFSEKTILSNGKEIIKPFTPHFVYHGSGVLEASMNKGCLVCQQDCSGGLICNNQEPCVQPVPLLKPNWDILPVKGHLVTLVIYVPGIRTSE
jgi:hypothetical protein